MIRRSEQTENLPSEPQPEEPDVLDPAEVERLVHSDRPEDRLRAVRDAASPPALGTNPDPKVRLWLSMRADITEDDRAAIDYHIGPDDRLPVLDWVRRADPETLDRCARSRHTGLRRSATHNPDLTPDQVAILAEDPDFAVRLTFERTHHVRQPSTQLPGPTRHQDRGRSGSVYYRTAPSREPVSS